MIKNKSLALFAVNDIVLSLARLSAAEHNELFAGLRYYARNKSSNLNLSALLSVINKVSFGKKQRLKIFNCIEELIRVL